jgi:hypothetical protein
VTINRCAVVVEIPGEGFFEVVWLREFLGIVTKIKRGWVPKDMFYFIFLNKVFFNWG